VAATKPSQTYLNLADEEKIGKDGISRKERKGRQGDGPPGQSSRANARDLRRRFLALLQTRISPGVYPELAEGVEMTRRGLCELSVLGAIIFLKLVLFNNSLVSI